MNSAGFEDSVFILNMRIRTIKDTLRLRPPPELFLEKYLDDLVFIDHVLAVLAASLKENNNYNNTNGEFDNLMDAEWQFSQLLLEFSNESSPFSANAFPQTKEKITVLRDSSDKRRRAFDEIKLPANTSDEPLVGFAEMNSLFGGN
jgi:hypothetical protein